MKIKYLSGITPSGHLTIGNYIGCIKQYLEQQDNLQKNEKQIIFVANLHAINNYDVKEYKKLIKEILAIYISFGINPNKTIFFIQSHMYEHSYLA